MTSDEFSKRYMLHKGLFTSEEFEDIMLSLTAREYEPKIFNRNPRLRDFIWDTAHVLQCPRKAACFYTSGSEKYINTQKVTTFSSNKDVLLGEIQAAHTHNGSSEIVGTEVEVTITERTDITFQSIESPKVLYEGTSNTWFGDNQLKVTLTQPILIKPQRIYEVRLAVRSLDGSYYFSDCQPMVEMDDGIKIQFHRNPTLDYDNLANGWISKLIFNSV